MKNIIVGDCCICGEKATIKSRLSPESFVIAHDRNGFIEYESFLFCGPHFNEVLETLWKRVENIW